MDKKKGLALILSMGGKGKKESDEGEDLRGSERASAGKAMAAALKSGDGEEIASAFEALMAACESPAEPESDESEDEEV